MYQIITDPATGNFCLFDTQKGKTTATAPATSHPHRRATRASIKYPDLTSRLWNAAELVTAGHIRPIDTPDFNALAQVQSETDPAKIYTIRQFKPEPELAAPATVEKWQFSCNCPDYVSGRAKARYQTVCKHILAVMIQSWQDTSPQPPAAPLAEVKPDPLTTPAAGWSSKARTGNYIATRNREYKRLEEVQRAAPKQAARGPHF